MGNSVSSIGARASRSAGSSSADAAALDAAQESATTTMRFRHKDGSEAVGSVEEIAALVEVGSISADDAARVAFFSEGMPGWVPWAEAQRWLCAEQQRESRRRQSRGYADQIMFPLDPSTPSSYAAHDFPGELFWVPRGGVGTLERTGSTGVAVDPGSGSVPVLVLPAPRKRSALLVLYCQED